MKDNEKKENTKEKGTLLTDENLSSVVAGSIILDTTSKKNTEAAGTEEQGTCWNDSTMMN